MTARAAGGLLRGLGQPAVIGEMLAGLALGPSVLGAFAPSASAALFPPDRLVPLATLSQLGVLLFMFVVGLRLDHSAVRGRARVAVVVSHASIVVPFTLGVALAPLLHPELAPAGVSLLPFALFLGAAMSVTAFPVLARILSDRGLLHTRLGAMAIACAAVDDVTAWCILAAVVAVARRTAGWMPFALTLAGASAYAALLATIGRRLLERVDRARADRGTAVTATIVGAGVVGALASAWVTERLGVHALFGAFLAGVVVPRARSLSTALAGRIEAVVSTVMLPVFFAFTGLRTSVGLVHGAGAWGLCGLVLLVAVAGKLGGSSVAARMTGMPWREAIPLGLLMNTRGLMELVFLNVGLEIGIVSPTLFAMLVLMALVTTMMTSPLLGLSAAVRDQAEAAAPDRET